MMFRFVMVVCLTWLLAQLTACATTPIKSVWKDPLYTSTPHRVIVIAVDENALSRRSVEDEFVLQLKTRGVDAIASYSILPDRSKDDVSIISRLIVQLGADSVLVTRMASKNQVREYYQAPLYRRPPHYAKWPDYYQDGLLDLGESNFSSKYERAMMETNLYAAGSEALLWAATNETGANNINQILIKPYIGSILNMMAESGVLKNKR